MIKIFPTNPGFTKQWTVVFDFEKSNGIAKEEITVPDYTHIPGTVKRWLDEEVNL